MPQGDPGGNFAGTGGYGGQFGGFGGASAGYSGGYGNPSSVGGGTAGQTYASQNYANTLNKFNQSLPNYSGIGVGAPGSGARVGELAAQRRARAAHHAAWLAGQAARAAATGVTAPTTTAPVDPVTGQPVDMDSDLSAGHPPGGLVGIGLDGYTGHPPGGYTGGYGMVGDSTNKDQSRISPEGGFSPAGVTGYNNGFNRSTQGNEGGIGFGNSDGQYGPEDTGGGIRRQFGGPVAAGQQYTVGENGPETLQMGPGGGGQVIPHNPMDRLGGMNPQMMQQLFQMQRQFGGGGGQQPGRTQPPMQPPAPPSPPAMPTPQPPQAGGWQNRMGIEGLSRPRPPGGGFGLSGLGQPGVMGQLRRQGGFAG